MRNVGRWGAHNDQCYSRQAGSKRPGPGRAALGDGARSFKDSQNRGGEATEETHTVDSDSDFGFRFLGLVESHKDFRVCNRTALRVMISGV